MQDITFESGLKSFRVNGDDDCIIRFNPTDLGFIDRVRSIPARIEAEEAQLAELPPAEKLREEEKIARASIDEVFAAPIADKLFGATSCLSPSGGQPLYANFLDAILPIIEKSIKSEAEKSRQRIEKYTSQVRE